MKNAFYLSIALAVNTLTMQAQDIHFSNTEYAPLILNPALAGANSPIQANIAYRTQWGQLGSSFRTANASFDARITNDNTSKSNFLALGLSFFNDRIGDMGILTNNVSLAIADHIRLNAKSQLSLGINAGYAMRSFDNADGMWASQYNGVAYNSSLASGEDFNNQSFGYFDAGAGILYTYTKKVKAMGKNANKRVNVGVAAYHITRPNNSFIELASEKLPVRYTAFANADISIDGTDGDILPGVYYQRQGSFSQLLLGTYYKYKFNNGSNYTGFERPFAVSLGVFTRLKDSYIAKLMIDWDMFSLGYAYDFTTSSLTLNSNRLGANEIFLRFNVGDGGGFRFNRN
jgi:type IX secretion system PorP/SprF family membrane protein